MNDPAVPIAAIPPPPRPASPHIRRRAWAEPMVRFWWLLAVALLVLGPFVGAPPLKRWQILSRLADQTPIPGKLLRTHREAIVGRPVLPGDRVQIEITDGVKKRELWGTLDGWSRGPLPRVGETIDIRIDPDNPEVWAVVDQVPSLIEALATGIVVAATGLLPLLIALVQRSRVLKVWRQGEIRDAAVISRQTTALAPAAWSARCAWLVHEQAGQKQDRAIFRVFLPKRLPQAEVVAILALPDGGKRIAVDWFIASHGQEYVPMPPRN